MHARKPFQAERSQMVNDQLLERGILDARVLEAMNRVPREAFLPADMQFLAYADRALPIACGQTMSQPYMVAVMTEALKLHGEERVLEIGTGSGYQAAVLAELAQSVLSIERHPDLARKAAETLKGLGYDNVRVIEGDGTRGYAAAAPFDRILVTAGATSLPPALWEQLDEGGVMVIPVGDGESQILHVITKTGGKAHTHTFCPCRFVPLVPNEPLTA